MLYEIKYVEGCLAVDGFENGKGGPEATRYIPGTCPPGGADFPHLVLSSQGLTPGRSFLTSSVEPDPSAFFQPRWRFTPVWPEFGHLV